jgi:hypothetical protein
VIETLRLRMVLDAAGCEATATSSTTGVSSWGTRMEELASVLGIGSLAFAATNIDDSPIPVLPGVR